MNVTVTTDINKIKTGSEENDILVLITGDFCPDRRLEKLVKSGEYKAGLSEA